MTVYSVWVGMTPVLTVGVNAYTYTPYAKIWTDDRNGVAQWLETSGYSKFIDDGVAIGDTINLNRWVFSLNFTEENGGLPINAKEYLRPWSLLCDIFDPK